MVGRWIASTIVIVTMLALFVPGSSAQATEGTLFFTNELVSESDLNPAAQNICGGKAYAMTSVAPLEASGQKAAATPSYQASGCATEFTYTMPGATTLDGDATLQFFTSCDHAFLGYPAGISSYRGHLLHNGEELSQATIFGGSGPCVLGAVEEHTMALGTGDAEITAGDTLTVRIFWWTTNPQGVATTNAHYLVYGTDTPSGLTGTGLVVAADPGPQIVEDSLEPGDAADVAITLAEATNATYVYTWNATLEGSAQITYNASLEAGQATVMVRDGDNQTLADFSVSGNASDAMVVESVAAGAWNITVVAANATGTLELSIVAYAEPADNLTDSPSPTTSAGNQTADNGTAQDGDGEGGLVPGPGAPLVAVSLLAATMLVRRRQ